MYEFKSCGLSHPFQLLAWEPSRANEVTMVTVRPNFQDSVHVGYVCGLKKFTEYYTSVLCFTTPGDGPRSPAQRLRTHEDSECHHSGYDTVVADNYVSGCCSHQLLPADVVFVFIAPGAVGHLSFTDILDTSLKVSWKEPQEKNGLLTGSH